MTREREVGAMQREPRLTENRIVLAVRDLDVSIGFFENILGCQDVGGWGRSTGWCFLGRDNLKVMLGHCPDERPASQIGAHSYVAYVVVDDVDAFYLDVVRRGGAARVSAPQDEQWGMRECVVTTPDGHRIRFGQDL